MKKIIFVLIFFCLLVNIGISQKKKVQEVKVKKEIDKTLDMVLIPASSFKMGSDKGFENEYPVRDIFVDSFYIDKYEVTNVQYKIFCDSTKRPYPIKPLWDTAYFKRRPNYPVIYVSWEDANAYSIWVGKRLPTEAEWEKALKDNDTSKFFCGDTITHADANFLGIEGPDKWRNTSAVGSFPKNKLGLYDMVGNVWEWCNDYYIAEYYWVTNEPNPKGPLKGSERVIRGGSWDSTIDYLRSSIRGKSAANGKYSNIGFRCAISKSELDKLQNGK